MTVPVVSSIAQCATRSRGGRWSDSRPGRCPQPAPRRRRGRGTTRSPDPDRRAFATFSHDRGRCSDNGPAVFRRRRRRPRRVRTTGIGGSCRNSTAVGIRPSWPSGAAAVSLAVLSAAGGGEHRLGGAGARRGPARRRARAGAAPPARRARQEPEGSRAVRVSRTSRLRSSPCSAGPTSCCALPTGPSSRRRRRPRSSPTRARTPTSTSRASRSRPAATTSSGGTRSPPASPRRSTRGWPPIRSVRVSSWSSTGSGGSTTTGTTSTRATGRWCRSCSTPTRPSRRSSVSRPRSCSPSTRARSTSTGTARSCDGRVSARSPSRRRAPMPTTSRPTAGSASRRPPGFGCDDTRAPLDRVDPAIVLLPAQVSDLTGPDDPFAWLAFQGRWGEKAPSFNNGPQGPALKQSWTNPIVWVEDLGRPGAVALPPLGVGLHRPVLLRLGRRFAAVHQVPRPTRPGRRGRGAPAGAAGAARQADPVAAERPRAGPAGSAAPVSSSWPRPACSGTVRGPTWAWPRSCCSAASRRRPSPSSCSDLSGLGEATGPGRRRQCLRRAPRVAGRCCWSPCPSSRSC